MNIPAVAFEEIPVPGCCRSYSGRSSQAISSADNSLRRRKLVPAAFLLAISACSFAYAHSDGAKPNGDAKRVRKSCPTASAGHGIVVKRAILIVPAPADPVIQRALDNVSPAHIEHTISTLAGFRNRNTLSSMDTDAPPGQGITAAAAWIEAEFRRYSADCNGCLDVRLDTFTEPVGPRIPRPTTITNIYAILRGSDPAQAKRMFLVTGHYDSRGTDVLDTRKEAPGANDDASGVAVSLECARVLSRLHFAATLVFVAVAGEEQGLNGSAHLAHLARTEGWQLEGVLNNDIVGGDTTPGDNLQDKSAVRVFSEGIPAAASPEQEKAIIALGGESDSPSRELARAVAHVQRTYLPERHSEQMPHTEQGLTGVKTGQASLGVRLVFRRDRFLRGGDHTSFNKEGFAAVRFTEWRENFNHQHQDLRTENGTEYGDLLKFVDFNYVGKVTRLNAATLATLASAPPPPADLKIEARGLNNETTLRWTAPQAPPIAPMLYEVVWRDTSSRDWEYSQSWNARPTVGNQITVTLPVSKDNVIFGVRSIDAAGNRGIAVIPTVER